LGGKKETSDHTSEKKRYGSTPRKKKGQSECTGRHVLSTGGKKKGGNPKGARLKVTKKKGKKDLFVDGAGLIEKRRR